MRSYPNFRKNEVKGSDAPRTDTNIEKQVDDSLDAHPSDGSVERKLNNYYQG